MIEWLASPQVTVMSGAICVVGFWLNAHKTWWGFAFMAVAAFRGLMVLVK